MVTIAISLYATIFTDSVEEKLIYSDILADCLLYCKFINEILLICDYMICRICFHQEQIYKVILRGGCRIAKGVGEHPFKKLGTVLLDKDFTLNYSPSLLSQIRKSHFAIETPRLDKSNATSTKQIRYSTNILRIYRTIRLFWEASHPLNPL